jgi:hypothetical protein
MLLLDVDTPGAADSEDVNDDVSPTRTSAVEPAEDRPEDVPISSILPTPSSNVDIKQS